MNAMDRTSIQEQQYNLPKGWVRTTVGTIFTVVGGGTPSTARTDYWDGPIPWITSADIDDGGRISPRKNLTEKGIAESATNRVPPGSVIVVTRVGLGKAGLAHAALCFSQDSQGLVFSDDHCFPPFVAYQMRFLVSIFKQISRGTTISGVTKKQLLDLGFTLPPYREQHRIVAEIETQFTRLDAVVTAFKRVQANLKRYRASVLQAACTGRLVPTEAKLAHAEGRSYESADQLLQRILQECRAKWESEQLANMQAEGKIPKDDRWKSKYREPVQPDTSELPELPEGWVWTSVEQLVSLEPRSLQSGPFGSNLLHSEFQDTGVLAIGIDNVLEGRFSMGSQHRISLGKYAQLEKYAARPLDVLVTVMATVGRCCVVPANLEPAIITKHVYRISANKDLVAPPYLMTALWGGTEVRGQIFGKVQGQTRPGINGEILRRIAIPIPPLDEQDRIVAEVERRLSVIDELEVVIATNLKRADRLRQAILKRAFEGKLVPQDPTDEPAYVLLERIHIARERTTEKPKATPQQTKASQPTGQPKATTPVQGELALGFRE